MSDTNPQIEEQLDKLATICCEQLNGDESSLAIEDSTIAELLKSLLMSGYARKEGANLQVDIENRVKSKCQEPAMHRGGALSSITAQVGKKFQDLKRWESRQPNEKSDPKAANISSATGA
ncbi:hypothetical protein [Rubripirellula reticaptiva]|uniref:Uncharacterized protein n=1 Tax=Rubripirellula reticaptiva TaxID=2528013 RepID=A0A5C6EIN4_9BACT|nr:hypothetical protein [Rubripirellula reticaptiva]TWU48364.1 hypothetical protein Poly59_52100 [Rubripirellula reticaptiva]